MSNNGILLESGTNEVEILEFELGGQPFGVNVLKIQAIEQYDPARVTQIQLSHEAVVGTLLFRDACITLVDLDKELETSDRPETVEVAAIDEAVDEIVGDGPEAEPADIEEFDEAPSETANPRSEGGRLVLVMEFNNLKTAFLVDSVNRIHRVSWESITPLSPFLSNADTKFTGSLAIENREILLVDMEKVVTEILPRGQNQFAVEEDKENPRYARRAGVKVMLAEDSGVIREKLAHELTHGNYSDLELFADGKACLNRIQDLAEQARSEGKQLSDVVGALISDIEMPAMDGLALCRNIKENLGAADLPVIMFSSLINDQIARKCDAVGANAYVTKPQFTELVDLLDKFCLE